MNYYLKLGDCVELEEYATKGIVEKCSFKALNSRGEIIGVAMNGIIKKPVSKIALFASCFAHCTKYAYIPCLTSSVCQCQ